MPAPKKRQLARTTDRVLFQFKITLLETRPPIWRRILVPDETLDKLHEHIQTAMGWLGAALTARSESNQFKELLLRSLTHNIMILAQAALNVCNRPTPFQ